MIGDIGYSFTPGLQERFRSSLNGGPPQLPLNASTALQIVALHLPNFLGGSPIAPTSLLTPHFGGGTPDAAVRAFTTGTPPAPSSVRTGAGSMSSSSAAVPSRWTAGPVASQPGPSTATPPSAVAPPPDQGPAPGGPPGTPSISFGNGTNPAGTIGGGNIGGAPLLSLMNQMLRGSGFNRV